VPEFFQEAVQPAALGAALLAQLDDSAGRATLLADFERVHRTLRAGGSARAAEAVIELLPA